MRLFKNVYICVIHIVVYTCVGIVDILHMVLNSLGAAVIRITTNRAPRSFEMSDVVYCTEVVYSDRLQLAFVPGKSLQHDYACDVLLYTD